MLLWRPVGIHELALIFEADMAAFPPRLPDQPIFYPVLNAGYAEQIAREWNTAAEGAAGYVTHFAIGDAYAARFERHTVGARQHEELWVPAQELAEFNGQLLGPIEVVSACFSPQFVGPVPQNFLLAGQDARDQLATLATVLDYNGVDFLLETQTNELAVFANFPFWRASAPEALGCTPATQAKVLGAIRRCWPEAKRKALLIERGEIAV